MATRRFCAVKPASTRDVDAAGFEAAKASWGNAQANAATIILSIFIFFISSVFNYSQML